MAFLEKCTSADYRSQLTMAASILTIGIGLLVSLGTFATSASAQPAPTWNQELQSCVAEKRSLLAVFLVDESGSLRQTDPTDRRLAAVTAGLRSLDSLVKSIDGQGGNSVDSEVTLLGFAGTAATRVPWSSINDALRSENLSSMVDRDGGSETDYVNALIAARDAFASQAALMADRNAVDPCKIMFWFTDGKFDIVLRRAPLAADLDETKQWAPGFDLFTSTDGILEQGRQVICDSSGASSQGVADQLRDAGVIGITLALTTQIEQSDKDFLESIAENPSDNPCGGLDPSGEVIESEELIDIECELGTPLDGTTANECRTTDFNPLVEVEIFGDPGMDRARASVSATTELATLMLRSPNAADLIVTESGLWEDHSGAEVAIEFTANESAVVMIDFDPSSRDWIGDWSLVASTSVGANAGARASTQITYWGDYIPAISLSGDGLLRVGDPGQLTVEVVTSAASPVEASSFAEFVVDVDTSEPEISVGPARREGEAFVIDISTTGAQVGQVTATATISATTDRGIELEPVTRSSTFNLDPPPGYPIVQTTSLAPSTLVGPGRVPFVVIVEGAPETDGCAWFSDLVPDPSAARLGPDFVFEAGSSSSGAACVPVPAGEEVELNGEIVVSDAAQGRFRGTVGLMLQARPDMELQPAEVQIEFSLDRPVDEPKRWLLFLLLLGAGLVVPLIVTGLVNQFTARFRTGERIKHLLIEDVIVGPATLSKANGSPVSPIDPTRFELGPDDADRSRGFQIGPFSFTAAASLNPFSAPVGRAHVPGQATFSSAAAPVVGQRSTKRHDRTGVNLALPGQWVYAVRLPETAQAARTAQTSSSLRGSLLVVVLLDDVEEADVLAADAAEKVPSLVDAVIETLPEEDEGDSGTQPSEISYPTPIDTEAGRDESPQPEPPAQGDDDADAPRPSPVDQTIVLNERTPVTENNPWA